jgi:membrane associated rhomboid family serine protease
MFYKSVITSLVFVFAIQNLSFFYIKGVHATTSKGGAAPAPSQAEQLTNPEALSQATEDRLRQDLELWNCVNLYFGASITPSLIYRKEFWRLIACFFLHENFLHFAMNALIVLTYSQCLVIEERKVALAFLPALLLSNLMSAVLYPEFLKIGASTLSFYFCGISMGTQQKLVCQETAVNVAMIFFLIFSIKSGTLDHSAHFFGLFIGLFYALCYRRKIEYLFWMASFVCLIALSIHFWNIPDLPENRFAVELDYGCGYVYDNLSGLASAEGGKF